MTPFEIIALLISSGVFSALLALFYRFGQNQERQDVYFKSTDKAIGDLNLKIDQNEAKFNAKIDKAIGDFTAKIDKVDSKIDKVAFELNAKIDRNEAKFNAKLDSKIDPLEKDLIQMNTRIAVIETRLADISTNVTHLMWHNQAIPPKEELKGN